MRDEELDEPQVETVLVNGEPEPVWRPDDADRAGIMRYPRERMVQIAAQTRDDVDAHAAQLDRIANYVQAQPTRAEYDALHADVVRLSDLLAAQALLIDRLAQIVAQVTTHVARAA